MRTPGSLYLEEAVERKTYPPHPHSLEKGLPELQVTPVPVCFPVTGVPMLSVQPKGKQKGCAGCNRKIKDRYLLKALDKYWHEDCLKCACCDCRLGEVGSTLYTKANLILCRRDYLRWVLLLRPARTAPVLLVWSNSAPSSKPDNPCAQPCVGHPKAGLCL